MDHNELEVTPEGAVIIEHVAEAWRLLLLLPERGRVTEFLQGCYDWSEVENDYNAAWRASLRTVVPNSPVQPQNRVERRRRK